MTLFILDWLNFFKQASNVNKYRLLIKVTMMKGKISFKLRIKTTSLNNV